MLLVLLDSYAHRTSGYWRERIRLTLAVRQTVRL